MKQPAAQWKNDCQGKMDYDASIIKLSCRFWPRGGGFHLLNTATGTFEGNEARPEIKPSAHASIHLRFDGDDEYEELIEAEFEDDDPEVVRAQVEKWAQEQFEKVEAAVRKALTPDERS